MSLIRAGLSSLMVACLKAHVKLRTTVLNQFRCCNKEGHRFPVFMDCGFFSAVLSDVIYGLVAFAQ